MSLKERSMVVIGVAVLLYVLYFVLESTYCMHCSVDTGWFAEPAYTLAFHGFLGMRSWKGFLEFDRYVYWMMPLDFVLQACVYRIFGFGLWQTKFLSFLFGIFLLALTYRFAKEIFDERIAMLSVLLLLSNHIFLLVSTARRPDILVGFFSTLAFYFAWKSLNEEKNLIFSFFSCALALLSHGIGLVTLLSILSYLSLQKGIKRTLKASLKYSPFFLAPFIPYLFYVAQAPDVFLKQFLWNASGKLLLEGIIEEIRVRYVRFLLFSPIFLFFSLLTLYKWRKKLKNEPLVLVLFWLLFLALFIRNHASLRYFVCVAPLICIYGATLGKRITRTVVFLQLLLVLAYTIPKVPPLTQPTYSQIEERLKGLEGRILAPQFYFMFFPENMISLGGVINRRVRLSTLSFDYLVVDRQYLETSPIREELLRFIEGCELEFEIPIKAIALRKIFKEKTIHCLLSKMNVDCLRRDRSILVYRCGVREET